MALDNPNFLRRLNELCSRSDRVWITAMLTGLGFALLAAYPFAFTPSGKFWAYAGLMIRAGLYLWAGEALRGRGGETIVRLFRLGLVAGTLELLVDWGLIHWVRNGRLVYLTENDVVLLGSPIWMPVAWACVIVELGYPAIRLYGILRRKVSQTAAVVSATLVVAAAAGLTIGFYEYFAYRAGWWRYERANAMLGNYCALYIPLGEFFMFLPVLPIAEAALKDDQRPIESALLPGTAFAAAIAVGYAAAYLLLEFGRRV